MSTALKSSPLHERHTGLGAKMAEFGGWEMPLEYPTGVIKEHTAVRTAVGIFDVSHLGKAVVHGPGAADHVNATLSNDLGKIAPGKAQYTLCCDDATGGIVDDLIAYLYGDDRVFLVPNAANTAEVVRRLADTAPDGVEVENHHDSHAVLAVQGPKSDELLSGIGLPVGHDYMSFLEHDFEGTTITVCRTGYTGERGYELVAPNEIAVALWDALMQAGEQYGVLPAGLGARDTLRTEMGYPLHGNDISLDVTPNQARLGWACGWKKESFWGKERLAAEKAEGPPRRLRGLVANGRGIPRPGMQVLGADGDPIGEITSGTFSPTLKKGVAMALLTTGAQGAPGTQADSGAQGAPGTQADSGAQGGTGIEDGTEVSVDIRGRSESFTVTKPPFVEPGVR